jgi:hypothetical protein
VLALLASFAFGNWLRDRDWSDVITAGLDVSGHRFTSVWIAVLIAAAAANLWFLWREAKSRREPFFSPGMRLAIKAILPSYLVAAAFTVMLSGTPLFTCIVPIWILCHGLGLLSTMCFSPRSLSWLGAAFVSLGLFASFSMAVAVFGATTGGSGFTGEQLVVIRQWQCLYLAQQWMALSFGLLHLIYAACTWPRRAR